MDKQQSVSGIKTSDRLVFGKFAQGEGGNDKLKLEKDAFCNYLVRQTGKAFLNEKPGKILPLKEVLETLSEIINRNGPQIGAEDIKAFFFRHGFLKNEKNTVMDLGNTHVAGNTFFFNPKGFGHPNGGRPAMTPPQREILIQHLSTLFEDLLVSKAPNQPDSLRLHIRDLFYMTLRRSENGEGWSWSFDFEKAEDSHYVVSDGQIEKLTGYLQQKMNSKVDALSVLIMIWMNEYFLNNKPENTNNPENALVSLFHEAGVSYKQFHFY